MKISGPGRLRRLQRKVGLARIAAQEQSPDGAEVAAERGVKMTSIVESAIQESLELIQDLRRSSR